MRTIQVLGILVLLAIAVPVSPAHAGGVVTVCDEAHLLAALAGGGTVTFACSGVITLTNTITIAANTTIDGSGQDVTISGNNAVRVFWVNPELTLELNELIVANGGNVGVGAGVFNLGTLIVSNSTFSANNATVGGAIFIGGGAAIVSNSDFSGNNATDDGGAIRADDSTLIADSNTFVGNSASRGGGIFIVNSTVHVNHSTLVDNRATRGGAVFNHHYGQLAVSNSTLAGNFATYEGGGLYSHFAVINVTNSTLADNNANRGGSIYNENGGVTLRNTIIANSLTGRNCSGVLDDGGGNLSFPDATCPGANANPLLGPLQHNGGPTWTMALGEGSAAIDAGIDAVCAAAPVNGLDQRGITRPQGPHCDIGAVEQLPPMPPRIWLPLVHRR